MKKTTVRSAIVSAAYGLMCGHCHAQSNDEARQSSLYVQSVELPKTAHVCAANVPGFAERFRPAFDRWVDQHKSDIAAGEAFLRADAAKANKSFSEVETVTTLDAEMLRKASKAMIAENCSAILVGLGAPAS